MSHVRLPSRGVPGGGTHAARRLPGVSQALAHSLRTAIPLLGRGHAETYQHYLGRPGLRALERLVAATGARTLVAPHFYGAGVLEAYKHHHPEAFCGVVLTDYLPHALGVPPNLDLYVVADEVAAEQVARLGVPGERVHPTGIPIDPAFEAPADTTAACRELLGIPEEDDLSVALVMGGGLGAGALGRVVGSLLETSPAMHLVVLCGSNEEARRRLTQRAQRRRHPATFMGFTDRVRDLMAASAVLVSKPGGMPLRPRGHGPSRRSGRGR